MWNQRSGQIHAPSGAKRPAVRTVDLLYFARLGAHVKNARIGSLFRLCRLSGAASALGHGAYATAVDNAGLELPRWGYYSGVVVAGVVVAGVVPPPEVGLQPTTIERLSATRQHTSKIFRSMEIPFEFNQRNLEPYIIGPAAAGNKRPQTRPKARPVPGGP